MQNSATLALSAHCCLFAGAPAYGQQAEPTPRTIACQRPGRSAGRAGSRGGHARRRIAQAEDGRRARRSRQDRRCRAEADARSEDRPEVGALHARQRAARIQLGSTTRTSAISSATTFRGRSKSSCATWRSSASCSSARSISASIRSASRAWIPASVGPGARSTREGRGRRAPERRSQSPRPPARRLGPPRTISANSDFTAAADADGERAMAMEAEAGDAAQTVPERRR